MFTLTIKKVNLEATSVVLVKSTLQSVSVVCGLWPAMGGLPMTVTIDSLLYAYASTYTGKLADCVTISANVFSAPLSEGNIFQFDGVHFMQDGRTPLGIQYGLRNELQTSLTWGLCQDITINGEAARPPVCVHRLLPKNTTFFSTNDRFWLGIGQFRGIRDPRPGLLISTSIIEADRSRKSSSCEITLGKFAPVDFSDDRPNWSATFQPSSSSFQISPG